MMATTVGRVEIEVDADGSGLVRQFRAIGKRAGDEAGTSMGKSLQASLNREWSTRDANGNVTKIKESFKALDTELDKVSRSSDRADKNLGNVFKRLGRAHFIKQAAAWTALFLGAMEGLATLSSAAGGGIAILGGAIAGLIPGLIVAITAFGGLTRNLDNLPDDLKPAAEAFKGLADVFKVLQEELTRAAFGDTADQWKSLGSTITALTPALQTVAGVVNQLFKDFTAAVAPGTALFDKINQAIVNSAPIFDQFLRTIGKLGETLLDAFNNPAMQRAIGKLLDYVDRLFGQFNTFVNSERFTAWIESTERILGSFGGLLDATGRMLNNLVTPEAVDRIVSFIDNLSAAMPFLQELFEVFGELDAFGLIAQILNDVGNALTPILDVLTPIASIINDVLTLAIENLSNAFAILEVVLLPLRVAWEFFAALVQKFVEYITPVYDAINEVIDVIGQVVDQIWNALAPAIDEIAQAFIDMLPSPEEFERFLREELIPKIQEFGNWIITYAVPAIEEFARWMRDEAVPAMQQFWDFVSKYVIPVLAAIADGFGGLPGILATFGAAVRTMVLVAMGPLGTLLATVLNVIDAFNVLAGKRATIDANPKNGRGANGVPRFASGGILAGPRRILAGESGPEAIVPLRRSLSQVDPSVRFLSAVAQGEMPRMATGGIAGGGRQVIFQAGAILVQGANNDEALAVGVVNRIVERLV
jgi:phage-related protein